MIQKVDELISEFVQLEDSLNEYNTLTNILLATNLDETEQTDSIFLKREVIIKHIEEIRTRITAYIDIQDEQEANNIRKMLLGQASSSGILMSDKEKSLHSKIIDVRSLQIDILKKDKENTMRFNSKHVEVHSELVNLQADKKKINFYNNASLNIKGETFNSHN